MPPSLDIMIGQKKFVAIYWQMITLWILLANICGTFATVGSISKIVGHVVVDPVLEPLGAANLTDLLFDRVDTRNAVYDNARQVVSRLSVNVHDTCGRKAAARLLGSCKAVESDVSAHRLLDNLKSVYAIRLAVCEAGEAKASVPSACVALTDNTNNNDLRKADIEYFRAANIESCLEALRQHHYFWTSYSNNRQDASTLCDASRIDFERENLLDAFRQLTDVVPSFLELIQEQEYMTKQWLTNAMTEAEILLQYQAQNFALLKDFASEHAAVLHENRVASHQFLNDFRQYAEQVQSRAMTSLSDMDLQATKSSEWSMVLKQNLEKLYTTSASELAAFLSDYMIHATSELEVASALSKDIVLHMNDVVEVQQSIAAKLHSNFEDFSRIQQEQKSNAEDQLLLGRESLKMLHQSNIEAREVHETIHDVNYFIGKVIAPLLPYVDSAMIVARAVFLEVALIGLTTVISGLLFICGIPQQIYLGLWLTYCIVQLCRCASYALGLSGLSKDAMASTMKVLTKVPAVMDRIFTTSFALYLGGAATSVLIVCALVSRSYPKADHKRRPSECVLPTSYDSQKFNGPRHLKPISDQTYDRSLRASTAPPM